MFEKQQKQAIIVYRKEEIEYAHLLANLISHQKTYEVAEWEEKYWYANKSTTSSSQKVIFIGGSKAAHQQHRGIRWQYDMHKMKYGWLGNKCIIDIDTLSSEEFKGFVDYYKLWISENQNVAENQALPILEDTTMTNEDSSSENTDISEVNENNSLETAEKKKNKTALHLVNLVANPIPILKIPNIIKLSKTAFEAVKDKNASKKLIEHQYSLLLLEFVFNGGLEQFMEG